MKATPHWAHFIGVLAGMLGLWVCGAWAVEDGLGTNHIGALRVTGIEMDGVVHTTWPSELISVGGTVDFRAQSNRVVWAPAFRWTGELETVRLQTDGGDAHAQLVRAKWNDAWDTYTVINEIQATVAGVETSVWTSSWVSNSYRVGIVITNYSTGTNLWWSVDCRKTAEP